MKLKCLLFSFLFTGICLAQQTDFSKNELIVELKPNRYKNASRLFNANKDLRKINDSLRLEAFKVIGNKKVKRTLLLKFKTEIDVEAAVEVYSKTGLFEYVEPNYIGKGHGMMQTTPNDPYFTNRQWSHVNAGNFPFSPSTLDADIDTDLAWDITQGDPNLIVAILDTGIKLNHPEFTGRIIAGYDFVNNDANPTDDHGHGTNVAGIALASGNNAIGYAGINWNSKIMACKIINADNFGYYSWWADAIYYAVDNGAKVINLSAGGDSSSTVLLNAINYAYNNNVSVVVSSGNQNGTIQYPAKYANAIAVGSTNSNDSRTNPFFWSATSGSNYGPELDYVAPGNYIYGLDYSSNTNYDSYWGGTSQAAPHAAGLISLMLSVNPSLTVAQIRTILTATSEDMVGDNFDTFGWDMYYGHGRINANNALLHPLLSTTDYHIASKKIKLYPNPINSDSVFAIDGLETGVSYDINVISLDGKVVKNLKNVTATTNIEIESASFQSGFYMVQITNRNDNSFFSKKLIKK